jgi:intein-encoded DNA endonuclease-like protein
MRNTLYKLQDEYEQERHGNKDVRNELKERILELQNQIALVKRLLQKF